MSKKIVKSKPPLNIPVGDYIADTAHLSLDQHGAYLLMLMFVHSNGYLPTDDGQRSRIVRLPLAEWQKIKGPVLNLMGRDSE